MLLNSRSLRNKVDERSLRANQTMSDLICVTETWFTDDLPDEAVEINGYSIVRKDTADYNNGGGVCIYVRNTIPFTLRLDMLHSSIECVWAIVRPNWLPRKISKIAVATTCLPPSIANVDNDGFYDYLWFCIDTLISESTKTAFIIAGDFNPNSNNFRLRHIELQCGLKQMVHVPTRKEHILGLTLTNLPNYYRTSATQASLDTSDHLLVL